MALTYRNPIWPGYFADPFILRWQNEYFAYGTGHESGFAPAGAAGRLNPSTDGARRAFTVLRSPDLVTWHEVGGALIRPAGNEGHSYWAPEVAVEGDRFLLYYSSAPPGQDELHRLRVAVADAPAGPFLDAGAVLASDHGFAIDAHPFRDPATGRWHLFFARDFFNERAGTGLAVVPLTDDLTRAAAPPRTVLRANADWQIYERNRTLYGRKWAAWHTVEGPCVILHEGRYYCLYSGGNWQTRDYGVSFGVADHPMGPWEHAAATGPVVLRERSGEMLGPGHNSHILAPDGVTELLVYHAWDSNRTARRMCFDRLVWTPDGPRCLGPTTSVQTL
jgi:GH43 family beta-xylosidase